MSKNTSKYANLLHRQYRRMIFAGVLFTAGAGLALGTNYATVHRPVTAEVTAPETMARASFLREDFKAREEAAGLEAAIEKLDTISLTSHDELAALRESYDRASDATKTYVDEKELLRAEEAYAKLESEREDLLAEAFSSYDMIAILDYAECDIQTSGDADLDRMVQELIDNATTDDMSRGEKLTACYDYMVATYDYGYNYNYSYAGASKTIPWAKALLRDGYGACNNWSSAFAWIARALGYEVRVCYGSTASSGGGGVEHYWPILTVDGHDFVFDPQVERDMTRRSGSNNHMRYGMDESSAAEKYFFGQWID